MQKLLVSFVLLFCTTGVLGGKLVFPSEINRDRSDTLLIQNFVDNFFECNWGALTDFRSEIKKNSLVLSRHNSYYVHKYEKNFILATGNILKIDKALLGKCNLIGDEDCGQANFFGLVVSRKFENLKSQLTNFTGIDYSLSLRDPETKVTLRPVLTNSGFNESLLYCDFGNL